MSQDAKNERQDLVGRLVSWRSESGARADEADAPDSPEKGVGWRPGEGPATDRRIKKRRWTPVRIVGISLAGIFVFAVLYEFLFGDHRAKLNVKVERIAISTVQRGPFQEFIPVRGTVLPIQAIYLDALEGGRVEQIFVEEGNMVKLGDPILKLSNPDLELRVMNQEALLFEQNTNLENTRINIEQQTISRQQQLIQFEHSLQQAEREYLRDKELMERELISRNQYDGSRDTYEYWMKRRDFMIRTVKQDSLYRQGQLAQLEVAAKRLQMNLEAVKRNLESLILRAPVSGQLTSLNAEIGELKARGQRLGQVDVLDGYRVRAEIDEFYIARISAGQTGTVDLSGNAYRLVIRKVYPEVREGQFEVDLEFAGDTPEGIRRGQTLPIRLALGDLSEVLLLARGGFYQTTGGNWVFAVDPSGGSAVRRPVRIGRQNPEYFEVLEGLEPGDRVITSSYENYEEIEKLILKE